MQTVFIFIYIAFMLTSRFLKDVKKRRLWLKALNWDEFVTSEHSCVCSEHFENGWHSDNPSDENFVPTIFSYKEKPFDVKRQNRATRRNIQKVKKVSCFMFH